MASVGDYFSRGAQRCVIPTTAQHAHQCASRALGSRVAGRNVQNRQDAAHGEWIGSGSLSSWSGSNASWVRLGLPDRLLSRNLGDDLLPLLVRRSRVLAVN